MAKALDPKKPDQQVQDTCRSVGAGDADKLEELAAAAPEVPLIAFLESLDMAGLDLTRDRDPECNTKIEPPSAIY